MEIKKIEEGLKELRIVNIMEKSLIVLIAIVAGFLQTRVNKWLVSETARILSITNVANHREAGYVILFAKVVFTAMIVSIAVVLIQTVYSNSKKVKKEIVAKLGI